MQRSDLDRRNLQAKRLSSQKEAIAQARSLKQTTRQHDAMYEDELLKAGGFEVQNSAEAARKEQSLIEKRKSIDKFNRNKVLKVAQDSQRQRYFSSKIPEDCFLQRMDAQRLKKQALISENISMKQRLQALAGENYRTEEGKAVERKTFKQLQEEDALRAMIESEERYRKKAKVDGEKRAKLEARKQDAQSSNRQKAFEHFSKSALSAYHAKALKTPMDSS